MNHELAPGDERECLPEPEEATDADQPDAPDETDDLAVDEAGYGYGV